MPPDTDISTRQADITEENIRALVEAFYARVRTDALLGPIFNAALDGRWDGHLRKLCRFWASLALGAKTYQGNVKQAHRTFTHLTSQHFNRWLYLFLDTVEARYEPPAAVRFMEPALRIAQSLQLTLFGPDYQAPAEQQALLERIAPARPQGDEDAHRAHAQ